MASTSMRSVVICSLAVPLALARAASDPPTVTLRNGVKMPLLAAGSWQYNVSQAYDSISAALRVGFTMVDTALDYGNQAGVGRAIAAVPRDRVFVETKVPGCGLDKSTVNPFKCYEDTKKNLATDLQLLNVSYVDLVILHFPPLPSMIVRSCGSLTGSCEMARGQWKAMEEFYKAGKARAIGVSNYCPSCFDCLKGADIFPMVNQVAFHLGMGPDPAGFVTYGKKHGVQVQGYSVLGNTPWAQHASDEILHGSLTSSIARAHNKSTVAVALKWVVSQGVPAVTKSGNPAHLADDLDLWSWDFTSDELDQLNKHKKPWGMPSFACNSADEALASVIV